jgi:hypothetical protein
MTTVIVRCRVADFDAWRPEYEQFLASPFGENVRSARIWRGQDDPNLVLVEETYDSREVAEAEATNPEVEEAMVRHGVDLSSVQIDYLDEVGSPR